MKLKLTPEGQAFVTDGKPVYVHDDGKEIVFDAVGTSATITRLNNEAKGHRERAEAFEARLKPFDGIEDVEPYRKAFELVKNIDEGKLLTAGKVEEFNVRATKAAEDRVAAASRGYTEEIAKSKQELEKVKGDLYAEKIGGAFARSKFFADEKTPSSFKFSIPPDMAQAFFGGAFKVENGKTVAYDAAGNKLASRIRLGEDADFDEALEMLWEKYPNRDSITRASGASGGGASQSSQNAGGKKTITRVQFDAKSPLDRMAYAKGDGVIVD